MKLEFEAPLGRRLHRGFFGVTHFEIGLWWSHEKRAWLPAEECGDQGYSTHAPCRTLRAFIRHLRKNPNIVGKAILVSRYVGCNVFSRACRDSAQSSLSTPLVGQEEGA